MSFHKAVLQTKNIRKELSRYLAGYGRGERASLTLSGTLTVEAALVLPFFLMISLCFMSLFYIIQFQLQLQAAMDSAVQKAASYYYAAELIRGDENTAEEINGAAEIGSELLTVGITAAYLRTEILLQMDERIFERAHVWGGKAGLTFLQSEFPNEDGAIDLVVSYQIEFPFLPGSSTWMVMSQRSRRMAWTGSVRWSSKDRGDGEEDQTIVYITEHGSVYHVDLNCTHLRLNIKSVRPDEVVSLRNKNGECYSPCEKCKETMAGFYLYVTESGERYHYNLRCSGLTRNIQPVAISEVNGRAACSRCGGKD